MTKLIGLVFMLFFVGGDLSIIECKSGLDCTQNEVCVLGSCIEVPDYGCWWEEYKQVKGVVFPIGETERCKI